MKIKNVKDLTIEECQQYLNMNLDDSYRCDVERRMQYLLNEIKNREIENKRIQKKKQQKKYLLLVLLALIFVGVVSLSLREHIKSKEHQAYLERIEFASKYYDQIYEFKEGMAKVKLNGRYGFINEEYFEIIPVIYNEIHKNFSEGFVCCTKNGKVGYLDKNGNIVVPFKYDNSIGSMGLGPCGEFREGRAEVWKNGKKGFIDYLGNEVIPIIYDDACCFCEGLAPVKKDGRWGYVDKEGKTIVPFIYTDIAGSFSEGLAAVKSSSSGYYGFINRYNEIVIPHRYYYAGQFKNGRCWVRMPEDIYEDRYIDKNGNLID